MPVLRPGFRLDGFKKDAGESVFFARQLEAIDQRVYQVVYADLKARSFIPTQQGIPDWARGYTWRMFDRLGAAEFIDDQADDLPTVNTTGAEQTRIIKNLAAAYGWSIFEIQAAMNTGTDLDGMLATNARYMIEQKIDSTLALGSSAHNLLGLLNQTGTTTATPATKGGGGTAWTGATADEIVADIAGAGAAVMSALQGANAPMFGRFSVLLPLERYTLIAQKRMGDGSDTTVLKYCLGNIPWIENIDWWSYLSTAGASSGTRMVCYPKNDMVVAGIVPREFETMAPQQVGIKVKVPCIASTGGVVCRYPIGVAYSDAI